MTGNDYLPRGPHHARCSGGFLLEGAARADILRPSRWHAEEAARKISLKRAPALYVYECPVCGQWHLTKQVHPEQHDPEPIRASTKARKKQVTEELARKLDVSP